MRPPASALAREIRQKKPFHSARQEAALGLLKTVDLLRARFSSALEPYGVTVQQYNVLRILRGAGPGGLPTLEIADRMIEHAPGITRLLDRLEAKELVSRKRCAQDRRRVLCTLAAPGARLLSRMDAPVRRADDSLDMLTDPELSTLIRLLDRMRTGLAAGAFSKSHASTVHARKE
jgi:MarR family transcriptional regulator, organic hydroperoxide resistance regulator